jgi:hypothetical protein
MNRTKLPKDIRILKILRHRTADQTLQAMSHHDRDESIKEFVKLMQKTKEFRDLSDMAC